MDRKGTWIIAGSVFLGFAVCGLSYVFAQRADWMPDQRGRGEVGRYQVVRSTEDVVIIIDTTTGDLYKAEAKDIKPFSARPKPEPRGGGREIGGFKDAKDGPAFKDDFERKSKDARRPMKDDFQLKDAPKFQDKEKGDHDKKKG